MHRLLQRQLKKFFGSETELPEAVRSFVAAVNESYQSFASDQEILHRSMELSSEELTQSNSELRAVFEAIPDLILRLDRDGNIVPLKAVAVDEAAPTGGRFGKRRISNRVLNIPNAKIRDQFQQALQALETDRQPRAFEYAVATEFGEIFYEVRLMPLMEKDAIAIIQDVTRRKQALAEHERLNQELVKASRQAGMAEVATGVLHNVGNVLNSVNVSAALLRENIEKSQIRNFAKAAELLRDHATDTVRFITADPKGQRLPGYLIKLSDHLVREQQAWQKELDGLGKNIEHIKDIVALQQNYASASGMKEVLEVESLVEDSLRMSEEAMGRSGIKVVRNYQPVAKLQADRHKALQILVNLIRNAKHALIAAGCADKTLTIKIDDTRTGFVSISVTDNGVGISPANMAQIFQHGFTTKKDGHGFGLHSSANAAREMGGQLTVHSAGVGSGACFCLELPIAAANKPADVVPTESTMIPLI